MCGIAGFYGFRDDNLIKKFSEQLSHRGPDGEGYYINDQVSLLNRRLAIIDRKGGDQPIYNEDRTVVVTYNGEIYNYQKLRFYLEQKGHKFKTVSDTEVIVHGYEEWSEGAFDRFNGMFAVALYDKKQNKLILVRDHFGIKPLYFTLVKSEILNPKSLPAGRQGETNSNAQNVIPAKAGIQKIGKNYIDSHFHGNDKLDIVSNFDIYASNFKLIFSSEIKPLINSGLIKKKPNDRIIYRYLRYRVHDDQRETFFAGVYKLMPGELLEVGRKKVEVRKYTNLEKDLLNYSSGKVEKDTPRQTRTLTEFQIQEFKGKLVEAIRLRLISEVPVGTCLSGGIDSSAVVAVVNKLLKEKVKEAESVGKIQNTFSAVFPGASNDEEKYINQVIKSIKLESHKVYPKPEEFFKELEEFVRTQEEPTISTGPYAQYKVMQEAHRYVTVLLDGQGADEMMAGYLPYYKVFLRQLWKEKKLLVFFRELLQAKDLIMNTMINRLIIAFGIKKAIDVENLLNNRFVDFYKQESFVVESNNLKKRLVEDIFFDSLQALLRYEDKNAMRFSLEGRVPFLDINLQHYLFSLPDEAIIKKGWNKFILRQSMRNLLPELILKRRNKIGFTNPEYEWFMRMKNKIYAIFLSESFAKRKYFNQPEVLKAFQKFIEGKTDDTMLFWRLMNLEIWMRVFFDSSRKVHKVVKSVKTEFGSNEGKKLEIEVNGKEYLRYPIKTDLFRKGDDITKKIVSLLHGYMVKKNNESMKQWSNRPWFLTVSEKIVAIAQGRSYFIWDIKTSFWANLLSRFVKKTPYGIGLGSPWTMQLAITEIGLPRILIASLISLITKPLGLKGLFYKIVGKEVAAIDGPTEYSLYPSNVSAKLGPKEPQNVAEEISKAIVTLLHGYIVKNKKNNNGTMKQLNNFLGVVIIDANDLGQKVLGNSTGLDDRLIEKIFSDNPMGQADEQTPLVLVF